MPPPKTKLHHKTGKLKTINKSYVSPSPSSTSTNGGSTDNSPTTRQHQGALNSSSASNDGAVVVGNRDSELDRQFELELCWCIQTMEASLNSGKLNAKQAQDTDKTIKMLKSPNQPVIKKRQIMRASFGDYRAKMAEEEKKLRLGNKQFYFTSSNSDAASKSFFVKKSALLTLGKEFKFNFEPKPTTDEDQNNIQINQLHLNDKPEESSTTVAYVPGSGSSFKFNFSIE